MNGPCQHMVGIITAAGLSSRMGAFKPLLPYGDSTLLEETIASMQRAGVRHIVVVVGYRGDEVAARLQARSGVQVIVNRQYQHTDMLWSIQLALQHVGDCQGVYVLPGDMPAVAGETFRQLAAYLQGALVDVVVPAFQGRRQHPPLIAKRCLSAIAAFRGGGGLRAALRQAAAQAAVLPVDDIGCSLDADTPTDYARLLRYWANSSE